MILHSILTSFFNLSSISKDEWNDLGETINHNLPRQEETITEVLLLNIKRSVPCIDKIIGFSKYEEGRNGADFQWTIINHKQNISYNMRFQAKRIQSNLTEYKDINRHIGNDKARPMQINVFIDSSIVANCVPLYIFYNYLNNLSILPKNCCSIDCRAPEHFLHTHKVWGIAISPARKVLNNLNKTILTKKNKTAHNQKVATHIKDSMPIRCLFCPKYLGITDEGEIDPYMGNFLDVIIQRISALYHEHGLDESEDYDPNLGVVQGTPENVQEVLNTLKNFTDSPIPEERLTALSEKFDGCGALMITEIN
ncbi:DUF6615 family protein [Acetobacter pasteurianus]|uniref:Uncharacterized protein n=1 Tax=Acetobacter pasteurianus NBRC 3188 TaxID=1226663 RepID=A0A401WW78_ACEPA|nr:DUF6615 family protein [Acetobacter pasteurianus]GCD53576.1 hypothetical protein NBRC3188_2273 [Acetobacter pasteurianus NBRC 3188]